MEHKRFVLVNSGLRIADQFMTFFELCQINSQDAQRRITAASGAWIVCWRSGQSDGQK